MDGRLKSEMQKEIQKPKGTSVYILFALLAMDP
jgi:hypothetical protein